MVQIIDTVRKGLVSEAMPSSEEEETTQRNAFQEQNLEQQRDQMTFTENLEAGHSQTALGQMGDRAMDEGAAALETFNRNNPDLPVTPETEMLGYNSADWRRAAAAVGGALKGIVGLGHDSGEGWPTRAEDRDELLKGMDIHDWDSLLAQPTREAAFRLRGRIEARREENYRMSYQNGGGFTRFAAQMVDLDAVFAPMKGGMVGYRAISAAARRVSSARAVRGAIEGTASGVQAGALVGGVEAMTADAAEDSNFIMSVVMGAAMGNVLGAAMGPAVRKLGDDYEQAIITGDPTITATHDVHEPEGPSPMAPPEADVDQQSIGAARASGVDYEGRSLQLDNPDISATSARWIDRADDEINSTDFDARRSELGRLSTAMGQSKWFTRATGTRFQTKLFTSPVRTGHFAARNIFESSNGQARGQANSAMLLRLYNGRINQEFMQAQHLANEWAAKNMPRRLDGISSRLLGPKQEAVAAFDRMVMLERNARENAAGRRNDGDPEPDYSTTGLTTDDPLVIGAANKFDNATDPAFDAATGYGGKQTPMRGMGDLPRNRHYSPQRAMGRSMRKYIDEGRFTREELTTALARGLESRGLGKHKDAKIIAKAVIQRAMAQADGVDTNALGLLSGDGADWVETVLEANGVSKTKRDGILKRLKGSQADKGRAGFTKSRNGVDMDIDIGDSGLKLVDVYSTDLIGDWSRYSRGVAGGAALARHGIDSPAAREEFITAHAAEQRALGIEEGDENFIHPNELRAQFTEFDAGPTKGWSYSNPDAAPVEKSRWVSDAKRFAGLAWLNKIAFAQVAETAATISQHGIGNFLRNGVVERIGKSKREASDKSMDNLAAATGTLWNDEEMFNPHLELDDQTLLNDPTLKGMIRQWSRNGTRTQAVITFFKTIKGEQQKLSAFMGSNHIFSMMRKEGGMTPEEAQALWIDFGLDQKDLDGMQRLYDNGVIEFNEQGYLERLNHEQWPIWLSDNFATAMIRNTDRNVQKANAGETDTWMHTDMGALLTTFKTFPMLASQKQLVNALNVSNPRALALMMSGFMLAGMSSVARAQLEGKEMSASQHAVRAFSYANATGWFPMYADPLLTMVGAEDYRFNRYNDGSGDVIGSMAPLEWANDVLRLPGAVPKALTGNADYQDQSSLRSLPFGNLIVIGDYLTSVGQKDK